MKVQLIFLRHAKALDAAPGQPDFDRALAERGKNQAVQAARFLSNHLLYTSGISFVSPALRTRQTHELALGPYSDRLEARYEMCIFDQNLRDVEALIRDQAAEWVGQGQENGILAMVGHNPGIGYLAERFGYERGNPFSTCTAVSILAHAEAGPPLKPEKLLWRFDADNSH